MKISPDTRCCETPDPCFCGWRPHGKYCHNCDGLIKDIPAALEKVDAQVGGALRRLGGMEPGKTYHQGGSSVSFSTGPQLKNDFEKPQPAPWRNKEPWVSIEGSVWDAVGSAYPIPMALEDIKKYVESFIAKEISAEREKTMAMVDIAYENAETIAILEGGTTAKNIRNNVMKVLEAARQLP